MSCGVGRRHGSDPKLLWLLYRPAATAPVQPLAWGPPYATGAALKKTKSQKKIEKKIINSGVYYGQRATHTHTKTTYQFYAENKKSLIESNRLVEVRARLK